MGNSLVHISPLLPAFLPWVVRAKEDDKQEQSHAKVPKKTANRVSLSLPIVPCISPVSDAGQEHEEEQSQSNLSSFFPLSPPP